MRDSLDMSMVTNVPMSADLWHNESDTCTHGLIMPLSQGFEIRSYICNYQCNAKLLGAHGKMDTGHTQSLYCWYG